MTGPTSHSLFSPSAAHRWIECPGSIAFPENQAEGSSSTFADNGTASHHFSANILSGKPPGESIEINGVTYFYDEERASFCQIYIDDVRRRAMGGMLFVEYHVDLSDYLGEGQGGTADALIYLPSEKRLIVEDLKYGTGEKVYADRNPQLLLYALGALKDAQLFGPVEKVTVVICQPRLGHIDEYSVPVAELSDFAAKAELAVEHARSAMEHPEGWQEIYLNPGEKQCRWCRVATCEKRTRRVAEEVMADFDNIQEEPPQVAVSNLARLSRMFAAVPFVEQWCKSVKAETARLVQEGITIAGQDGQPLKFVEGKAGSRSWDKARLKDIEEMLLGQLGPKAYEPQSLITAPAAGKLLDKAKTKATWELFQPFIRRAPGSPVLALGSDPRPPYTGAAAADDFEQIGAE